MAINIQEDTIKLVRRFAARVLLGAEGPQAEDAFELLQARFDILNVTHAYMDAANRANPEDFGNTFTEDGALALYLPNGQLLRENKGRAAVAAAAKAGWDALTAPDGFFEERHIAFQTLFVNLSVTSADTRTIFAVTKLDRPIDPNARGTAAAARPSFRYTGVYKTNFAKTAEGWKIKRREIHFD